MTELEMMERARQYMEKLANGINPLDGSVIPDGDVVNNVRLSRCFFYVEGVLRQVIANGGTEKKEKPKKLTFDLPLEKRDAFDFSQTPISVSEIAKRINDLTADENMKKLTTTMLTGWLKELGLLQTEQGADGKNRTVPTDRGRSMGITTEDRMGQYGMYLAVLYDLAAQRFILDNLDGVIQQENAKTENENKDWTPGEDAYLREQFALGASTKNIGAALKRSAGNVRARLKKLGLA